jgi:acyl-coenzyme A thioesterase 13
MSSVPELDHVKGVWQKMQGNSPIYDFLLSNIEIISATKGSVTARLLVEKNHVNSR